MFTSMYEMEARERLRELSRQQRATSARTLPVRGVRKLAVKLTKKVKISSK